MPASIALSTVGMSPRAKASYKSLIICTLLITRLLSGPGTGRYAGSAVLGRPAVGSCCAHGLRNVPADGITAHVASAVPVAVGVHAAAFGTQLGRSKVRGWVCRQD